MSDDYKALRELAEKATPGPWREIERCRFTRDDEACGVTSDHKTIHGHTIGIFQSDAYDECSHPVSKANAEFISAANPTAVLALLDENERLRWKPDDATQAVSLALTVINKYGADADKPSVHLATALIAGAHERDNLRQQLSAMTAARDEACDLAVALHEENAPDGSLDRISELLKVGS